MTTFDLGPTRALRPDEREDAPVPGRVDLFWKAHEEARNASNFDAHLVNYSNAFDAIEDRVRKATGEELANPFRSAGLDVTPNPFWIASPVTGVVATGEELANPVRSAGPVESVETLSTFSREAVDGSMLVSKWRERLQELQAKHPDKMDWSGIADEPGRVAFETMKRVRAESNAMQERLGLISPSDVPGVGKIPVVGPFLGALPAMAYNMATAPSYTAMQLAGGFYGQMKSPADAAMNLISFGVGGTAKSLLKNAALNAASNMAGQAILSAPKQASYRSAGLPYGLDVWAEEVAAAGGAGFALDMGIRAPVRAAVNRFGRDTAPGSPFSRNTERGGFLLDAANDATPRPTPRKTVTIDPETVKRAEAGDIAAIREIIERTGAIQDPTIRSVLDHVEGGGWLSDEAIQVLDAMGVARADGMRALVDAMQGRVPRMPDVVRDAPEPLRPERGAELSGEIDDRLRLLPQHVAQAVADGLEAGVPRIVRAVEDAIGGPPERFAEAVTAVLDPRTLAEIGMHAGRAGPVEMAQAIRSYPDLVDRSMPETPRIEMARDIARLSDEAYAKAVDGSVPPDVAAMVSREVPAEYQARAMADLDAARPRTMAEAMDLVRALTPPERPDVPAQPRMTEEAGAVQQRKVEALRGAAGQAYEAAVAPIRRRDAIEAEIETKRGQIAEMERNPPEKTEGEDAAANPVQTLRSEIDGLERELAELHREIDPSPTGDALYRVAMRALDMRRMSDIADAINEAVAIGRRMTPAGTRIDVLPDQSMVSRAANGDRYQLDATSDTLTGHIQLAVSAMDPAAKMGHEAVHTLVTLGHLSPDEVSALASLAREAGTFKDEAKYRAAYEGRTGLDRILQEEAAASYIEARIKGAVDGPENTVIERIRQLIERIKQVLAGKGFKSREDVVQAVMSGEAARRDARADWARNGGVTTSGDKMFALAARVGATRIEDVGESDPHPGRVLAYHGTDAPIFDRFSIDQTSLRNFGIHPTSGEKLFAIGGYKTQPRQGDRNAHIIMRRLADKNGKSFLARVVENGDDITVELYDDKMPETAEGSLPKGRSRLGRKLGNVDLNYMGVGHFATHGHRGPLYEVGMVEVENDQRMRGLAKAAYNMIEDMLGTQMMPSGTLLPPGYEHWKRRDPDLVRGHQFHRVDEVYYSPKKIKDDLDSMEKEVKAFDGSADRILADTRKYLDDRIAHWVSLGVSEDVLRNGSDVDIASAFAAASIDPSRITWSTYMQADFAKDPVSSARSEALSIVYQRTNATRERADAIAAERLASNREELAILRGMWRKVPKDLRSPRALDAMFSIRDADTPLDMSPEAREPRGLAEGETTTSLLDRLSSMRTPLARKQRARELGFDTSRVFYHGSQSKSIDAFDLGRAETGWRGKAVHVTLDPKEAELYGSDGRDYPGAIYPLYLRISNTADYGKTVLDASDLTADQRRRFDDYWGRPDIELTPENVAAATSSDAVIEILKTKGFDSARVGRTHFMVFDPSNIRSVNAEFDPAKADSPNLMFSIRDADTPLDMSPEARKQRAEEMGFDTRMVWYRGARDFDHDGPVWVTDSADYAENFPLHSNGNTAIAPLYVRRAKFKDSIVDLTKYPADHGFTVDEFKSAVGIRHRRLDDDLETLISYDMPTFEAFQAFDLPSVRAEFDNKIGIKVNQSVYGGGEGVGFLILDPSNIRSVNAEFDPAKADSPNLMFSVSQEPDLRADMAFVDRMNRIAELIPACRG